MARFDVYATPINEERRRTPFWLDVQADHVNGLGTRVIVPLRRVVGKQPLQQRLNPEFSVDGVAVYADVADIGAFPLALLKRPIASLRPDRLRIEDALDFLFMGY